MAGNNNVMSAIRKRGWLTKATPRRQSLPVASWPEAVQQLQRRKFTGLVEVVGSGEHSVLYLFTDGLVVETYCQQGEGIFTPTSVSLPPPQEEKIVVEMFALPLEGVRAVKTLIEQGRPTQIKWMATAGLEPFCRAISKQMKSGVVHVVWQRAEGFVLLSNSSALSGVFVHGEEIVSGDEGLAAIFAHTEASCYVYLYPEDSPANISTQEECILMRRAFTAFADGILFEYTRLVGRRLGNAIIFELNRIAREHGWNVHFSLNGTTDTHRFTSREEKRQVYRTLLHLLVGHISIVIGDQLALALVHRVFERIDEQLKPLLSNIATLTIAV